MEIKPIGMIAKDERIQKILKKMNEITSILDDLEVQKNDLIMRISVNIINKNNNDLYINNLQMTLAIINAYEQRCSQLEDLITECCVLTFNCNNIEPEVYKILTNQLNQRIEIALGTLELEFSSQTSQNNKNNQKSIRKN